MNTKDTKTATEAVLDWFERNPTAKARSGPLGKALKMDSAKCAEALSRLAVPGGPLLRAKVEVGAKDRQPGAAKEQWEYCLAAGGKAPEPVKPYKAPAAFRRPTTPPAVDSSALAKTKIPAPPAIPAAADETGATAKKIVNTTIDIKITDLPEYQAAVAQFEAALREAQISAAEWQKKYEVALSERDDERVEAAGKLAESETRIQQLEDALQAAGAL